MATRYAEISDLSDYGAPSNVLSSLLPAQMNAALTSASSEADGYLNAQYTLPLTSWGSDLVQVVCALAIWRIMTTIVGFNPEGTDKVFRQNRDDAIDWLKGVAAGRISPPGLVDTTPNAREGAPTVVSGAGGNLVGSQATTAQLQQSGRAAPYAFVGATNGRRGW